MGFFQINTPKDMLEKAKRELTRLETVDSMAADSIDHVYNFFVTACHIVDYLDGCLEARDVEAIKAEPLIVSCRRTCNKAKHMKLDPNTPTHHKVVLDTLGGQPNTPDKSLESDKSLERWVEFKDGTKLEVIGFARMVIAKWDELFLEHGIDA